MDNKELRKKLLARLQSLRTAQQGTLQKWKRITPYLAPGYTRFSDRKTRERLNGEMNLMLHEAAMMYHRILESGMMAGMSSPARPWFNLSAMDPGMMKFGPVKSWLDIVTKGMRDNFARGNIYSALPLAYGGIGGWGTAAFILTEDEKEVTRAYPLPVGSFYIDVDRRMKVDTLYRETPLTVRQVVEIYGKYDINTGAADWSNISNTVKRMWDRSDYSTEVMVITSIEPNFMRIDGRIDDRNKPWMSVTWEESGDDDRFLRISGYEEFPCIVPRWFVNGEDTYGSSCPGFMATPATSQIQLYEKRGLQALDKFVHGAKEADVTLKNDGIDLMPGGIVWRANMAQSPHPAIRNIEQIDTNIFPVLGEKINDIRERMRQIFYADMMIMLAQSDNPQMTAREIEERHQEKLLVLGPMLEQQDDDLFDPLIDRQFNLMMRRGRFPQPPEELMGEPLRVEYTSVMAQAQKLIGVASVERFVGFVTNLATATQDPSVLDKIKKDNLVDEYGDMTGVSSRIVATADEVAPIRAHRQQQMQQQQMAASMPALQQGSSALQNLGNTNVDEIQKMAQMLIGGVQR